MYVGYTLCLVRMENGAESYQSIGNLRGSMEAVHVIVELSWLVYNSNSISKLILSTYNKWNFCAALSC
jgi:hypothetical protein